MPRTCTVCSHRGRRKIDAALASGTSYRNISERFRVSRTALCRHKRHVSAAIEKASDRREMSIGESVLERLESLYQRATGLLESAEQAQNHFACIGYLRELRGILSGLYTVAAEVAPKPARMPAPEEYVQAVARALGLTGEVVPITRPTIDISPEQPALPEPTAELGDALEILPE